MRGADRAFSSYSSQAERFPGDMGEAGGSWPVPRAVKTDSMSPKKAIAASDSEISSTNPAKKLNNHKTPLVVVFIHRA